MNIVDQGKPLRLLILPTIMTDFAQISGTSWPDAVILTDAAGWSEIGRHISGAYAAIVPVINATDEAIDWADARVSALEAEELSACLDGLTPLFQAIADMPDGYFETNDPSIWLLARLATRRRPAAPIIDDDGAAFHYPDEHCINGFSRIAENLADRGLLNKRMVDWLKVCPHCASSHLALRPGLDCETCPIVADRNEGACDDCRLSVSRPAAIYHCAACGNAWRYDKLADSVAYEYDLNQTGLRAAWAGVDLTAFVVDAPERQIFCDAMRERGEAGENAHEALLMVRPRGQGGEKYFHASQRRLRRLARETLAPLAKVYMFERCVIAHFPDSADVLADSLPHLQAILENQSQGEADAAFRLDVIGMDRVLQLVRAGEPTLELLA